MPFRFQDFLSFDIHLTLLKQMGGRRENIISLVGGGKTSLTWLQSEFATLYLSEARPKRLVHSQKAVRTRP